MGEHDDAQVIFETLNSKGEPLLAMDLVRNNIFHRAEKQGAKVEELYHKLWDPLDDTWWREAAPNARPTRPRIDHFLAHTLAAETGGKISMRELYAEYRAFAVPKGKPRFDDVQDELRLLAHYAPLYETLEGRLSVDPDLKWFGRKMAAWQTTTVYPVAMQLGDGGVDSATRSAVLRLLYAYIVRRALCGLTTKNLNNIFQTLAARFREQGASVETFKTFFDGRTGDSIDATPNRATTLAYNQRGERFQERALNQAIDRLIERLSKEKKVRPILTLHGLRHTRGVELAIAGASDSEIMSQLEHTSTRAAEIYRRQANRRNLADSAQSKIDEVRARRDAQQTAKTRHEPAV